MAAPSSQHHENECAVCKNDFTTPKILPCGHLLCRECVISWLDTKPDAGCPLCRHPIVETSLVANQSSDTSVDALPTDFVLEALKDSASVLAQASSCQVCDNVTAEFICIQCLDIMCLSCANMHKKMSMSRSHDVESLSTVTPERLAASRPALCADHGDKQAEFFCSFHSLPVCAVCSTKKHQTCGEVCLIDDIKTSNENAVDVLMKILVQAEHQVEKAIFQLDARFKEMDNNEKRDIQKVDEACNRLQNLIEDCRKILKEQTFNLHSKIKNSLSGVKTAFSERLAKVTVHKHIVARARATSPSLAMIHTANALTDRVNSLGGELMADVWSTPLTSARGYGDVVIQIQKQLQMLEQLKPEPEKQHLTFNAINGEMTSLTYSKQSVASEIEGGLFYLQSGEVVSREPLKRNVLYQCREKEAEIKAPATNEEKCMEGVFKLLALWCVKKRSFTFQLTRKRGLQCFQKDEVDD